MNFIFNYFLNSFTGCLWAMNPTKVGKMDEEVQKWSRKDPQAIKKAMVYPGKNCVPTYLNYIFFSKKSTEF